MLPRESRWNLHGVGQVSCVGSALYRACTTSHNGIIRDLDDLDRDLSDLSDLDLIRLELRSTALPLLYVLACFSGRRHRTVCILADSTLCRNLRSVWVFINVNTRRFLHFPGRRGNLRKLEPRLAQQCLERVRVTTAWCDQQGQDDAVRSDPCHLLGDKSGGDKPCLSVCPARLGYRIPL